MGLTDFAVPDEEHFVVRSPLRADDRWIVLHYTGLGIIGTAPSREQAIKLFRSMYHNIKRLEDAGLVPKAYLAPETCRENARTFKRKLEDAAKELGTLPF